MTSNIFGTAIPARRPMITMTIMTSIRVKPFFLLNRIFIQSYRINIDKTGFLGEIP
jgi:hypothetical protein